MAMHGRSTFQGQIPSKQQAQCPPRVLRQDMTVTPGIVLAAVIVVTFVGIAVVHFLGELIRWISS